MKNMNYSNLSSLQNILNFTSNNVATSLCYNQTRAIVHTD